MLHSFPSKMFCERLLPILQGTLRGRRLLSSLEEVLLPGKQTTSLALVANELVSNAVKHGKGDVELTLHREGNIVTLEVCDDGPGFPEGFDPETAAHTGLDLIENIARYDLAAETFYRNRQEGGARVAISFSIPSPLHNGQDYRPRRRKQPRCNLTYHWRLAAKTLLPPWERVIGMKRPLRFWLERAWS